MDKGKRIGIGSDHIGLPLKNILRDYLVKKGYLVDDFGVNQDTPVDYPDVAVAVASEVAAGKYERAILVCGTGAGMAIVANKIPGVRAVSVTDPYTAERAIASNNAQIITFGSLVTGSETAKKLVDTWLDSEFQPERSGKKVQKIIDVDKQYHC